MEKKPNLRLIEKPKELKNSRNFWQCCPLGREYLPEAACAEGQPENKNEEPRCQWWINSEEHQFCFWRYIKDKSDADGVMKELVQSELAALFGWSNTKTHFMLKQAISELTEALKLYGALELLRDMNSDDNEASIVLEDFIDSEPSDRSE